MKRKGQEDLGGYAEDVCDVLVDKMGGVSSIH